MTKVLWLSNETPDRGGQGGQRRQFFQVRELARAGHDLTLCTLAGPQDATSVEPFASVVRTRTHWRGRVRRPTHRRLLRRLAGQDWDAIVVAHTESWPTFRSLVRRTTTPSWVDLHNVLGHDVDGAVTQWVAVEDEVTQAATVVSVCSELERARLLQQHPNPPAEIQVMTHGIDPAEWTAPRTPSPEPLVKLFGNWGWEPNTRGLDWFLREVWSMLDVPGARCEIAGSGATLPSSTSQDVTFVGRVPRLDEWTKDAWAVLVPVVGGVGAPVKYLEALATGAPVLSTSDGAPTAREAAALVSDDPQAWINVLHTLLRMQVAPAQSDVNVAEFSWESATVPLLGWLADR